MKSTRLAWVAAMFITFSGCAVLSSWHWEKRGAGEDEYEMDLKFCKQRSYSGTDGMVTNESVRRMHGCMEAKGWRKVAN